MFKYILRILTYMIIIVFMVLFTLLNTEIKKIDGCKREFEYVDKNGVKGTSKSCYKDDKSYICRNKNRGFRVKNIKEKRVCE